MVSFSVSFSMVRAAAIVHCARRSALASIQERRRWASTAATAESLVVQELTSEGVLRLTLNNPAKRNPFSMQMLNALYDSLVLAGEDQAIRCMIIGSSGNVFSSGHDLRELADCQNADFSDQADAIFAKCAEVMMQLKRTPIPVIAEVKGLATAAGCQLVASCDLAVAGESATFGTPGVKIGLFCTSPGVAVARALPHKQALRMLLTGDLMTSADALRYGLVSDVVPDDQVVARTEGLARKVATASRPVLSLGKRAFYRQVELDTGSAYDFASERMVSNLHSVGDSREGIAAFLSKQKPNWSHQ